MAKRDIVRAAKRAGYSVISAHYDWMPEPGEMVAGWEVTFQDATGEFDPEIESFANTDEAVEYFDALQPQPAQGEGK